MDWTLVFVPKLLTKLKWTHFYAVEGYFNKAISGTEAGSSSKTYSPSPPALPEMKPSV